MEKIGIVVAMTSEYNMVVSLLDDKKESVIHGVHFTQGSLSNKNIVVAKSGIGKVCSAVGIVEMINNFAPSCIINTGVAGGIGKDIRTMDVVVGQSCVYHDVWCGDGCEYGQIQGLPEMFYADKTLYEKAISIKISNQRIIGGLICSGDKFVTERPLLKEIVERFPNGIAVDMESCSMAQVCYMYGVPFLSFRIISDTPFNEENNFEQYLNFWNDAPEKSFYILRELLINL